MTCGIASRYILPFPSLHLPSPLSTKKKATEKHHNPFRLFPSSDSFFFSLPLSSSLENIVIILPYHPPLFFFFFYSSFHHSKNAKRFLYTDRSTTTPLHLLHLFDSFFHLSPPLSKVEEEGTKKKSRRY